MRNSTCRPRNRKVVERAADPSDFQRYPHTFDYARPRYGTDRHCPTWKPKMSVTEPEVETGGENDVLNGKSGNAIPQATTYFEYARL